MSLLFLRCYYPHLSYFIFILFKLICNHTLLRIYIIVLLKHDNLFRSFTYMLAGNLNFPFLNRLDCLMCWLVRHYLVLMILFSQFFLFSCGVYINNIVIDVISNWHCRSVYLLQTLMMFKNNFPNVVSVNERI